jgi:hypothetical protein
MGDRLESTLDRLDQRMEEVRVELELNRSERAETREFMRELTIRHEKAMQNVARRLEDMGDQIRANTAATWAMLDRLGPAG